MFEKGRGRCGSERKRIKDRTCGQAGRAKLSVGEFGKEGEENPKIGNNNMRKELDFFLLQERGIIFLKKSIIVEYVCTKGEAD